MKLSTLFQFAIASGLVAIACTQAIAENDIVAQWTFETSLPTTAGPHAAEVGTGSASGFHAEVAAVYSNPVGNGTPESFSSNNWQINDYYLFHSSSTGLMDLGVTFDQVSSSTGPRDFDFQYSTNGIDFTTTESYMVRVNASPNWSSGGPVADGIDSYVFDLRSITELNDKESIYFRLLNTSTVNASGNTVATTGTNRVDTVTIYSMFVPPTTELTGDYNGDDIVDAADYALWRDSLDSTADLNGDLIGGTIGTGQYNQWRENFGATPPGSGSATIPEPSTIALLLVGAAFVAIRRVR